MIRPTFPTFFAFCLMFVSPNILNAQTERNELGQRLKQFEQAWEKQPDSELRQTALVRVPAVTTQFFSLQLSEAGRTLDEARWVLQKSKPSDAVRFLESLYPTLDQRIVDADTTAVKVTLKAFYTVKTDSPKNAVVEVRVGTEKPIRVPLGKLPQAIPCPIRPTTTVQDIPITISLLLDGTATEPGVAQRHLTVTCWPDKAARLSAFDKAAKTVAPIATIEQATLANHVELLQQLDENTLLETDYPVPQLIAECETFAKEPTTPYFTAAKPGQFWLTVPTGKNFRTTCRVFVPKGLKPGQSIPVVVAMHGAGGSENLFFEGYGAGHIVRECEKRGWLLIAPRSGFLGAPPVADIVNKLCERYTIERKQQFLVGHSMGAAQSVEVVQQNPDRFRAVALLGGTGRVRKPEVFAELPIFIGVGTKDQLAYTGAKNLNKALGAAAAKEVTFKEYPGIEHMVIVREALPDVFQAWDRFVK